MKRLALMMLLVGGMFATALGTTQASPTNGPAQKHATKHSTKNKATKLQAQAVTSNAPLPTSGNASLTIRKDVCSSVNASFACNKDKSQDTKTVTYTVYDCTTGTCTSGQPITGTAIGDGTLTIGNPAGSGGASAESTFTGAISTGTSYAVCETSNTFTQPYYSVPRPAQSTGGQQSSVGIVNPLASKGECLFFTAGPGTTVANFLNVLKSSVDTATPTPTSTSTAIVSTSTPTATSTPTGIVSTSTPTSTPTATPTGTVPTSTPTSTPTVSTPAVQTIHKCAELNLTSTVCTVPYGNTVNATNGQNLNYIVTITNSSSGTASIVASDPLAAGQTFLGCLPTP